MTHRNDMYDSSCPTVPTTDEGAAGDKKCGDPSHPSRTCYKNVYSIYKYKKVKVKKKNFWKTPFAWESVDVRTGFTWKLCGSFGMFFYLGPVRSWKRQNCAVFSTKKDITLPSSSHTESQNIRKKTKTYWTYFRVDMCGKGISCYIVLPYPWQGKGKQQLNRISDDPYEQEQQVRPIPSYRRRRVNSQGWGGLRETMASLLPLGDTHNPSIFFTCPLSRRLRCTLDNATAKRWP